MKRIYLEAAGVAIALSCVLLLGAPHKTRAAPVAGAAEYAMIQWKGKDDTQVIWPDGHVDFLATLMPGFSAPGGEVHERAFIMNALMNKLGKQGYEYVGMASGEEIMMKKVR
jgi:hypothetical protein